jgi:putative transposase
MPRFARVVIPQCPHHITQRGNARRDVFFTAQDRQVYLGLLVQYGEHYGADILGYCLMTNHVHLVLVPQADASLAKTLREVNMRYAQYRNAIERGNGHLWQSRYYSCAVEPDRLGTLMRYVELNPVRAGMVAEPADYLWSSARVHLNQEAEDQDTILKCGDWNQCFTKAEWAGVLDTGADQSAAIREATYGGRPLGSAAFVEALEKHLNRPLRRGLPGRPRTKQNELAHAAGGSGEL